MYSEVCYNRSLLHSLTQTNYYEALRIPTGIRLQVNSYGDHDSLFSILETLYLSNWTVPPLNFGTSSLVHSSSDSDSCAKVLNIHIL